MNIKTNVDVLAVLGRAARIAADRATGGRMLTSQADATATLDAIREARAAVAELISENERLRRALRVPTTETFQADVAEHEATVARVGGGK